MPEQNMTAYSATHQSSKWDMDTIPAVASQHGCTSHETALGGKQETRTKKQAVPVSITETSSAQACSAKAVRTMGEQSCNDHS